MQSFLLVLLLFFPLAANANSQAIDIRNDFENALDRYRTNMPANKCGAFRNARGNAQSLMRWHADASLALRWNAMLPKTGCRQAPLIIDPAATNTSKNPKVNQQDGGFLTADDSLINDSCLPFHKILAVEWTRSIKAQCPGGGFISITAH